MKKISLVALIISIVLSAFSLLQASNYQKRIQNIKETQPTAQESFVRAFVEGFAWGLSGNGNPLGEHNRILAVKREIADLESKKQEASSSFVFWGIIAVISLCIFVFTKKNTPNLPQ